MLNHARELARAGWQVWAIGFREREFDVPPGVRVHVLSGSRSGARPSSRLWFLVSAGLRMGRICLALTSVLLRRRPEIILVQNPPSFPTLAAGWIAALLLGAKLLIDWHNYGYTMLGLRLGSGYWFARLAAHYEGWMARRANGHFCVSDGMRADLAHRFDVRAQVLYDRPLDKPEGAEPPLDTPLVAVCASGWTDDEDMELLFDALEFVEPDAFELYLTGDGPCRSHLEFRIATLRRAGWTIHTGFLSGADYRALLRRVAFGLSVHRSSSGLDLAMKVVDLFGAGVPVCAFDYGTTIHEQIAGGQTGFLFRSAAELAEVLARIAAKPEILVPMRRFIRQQWTATWADEWRRVAGAAFRVDDAA
jgi:beta-1,4-mannosyltransferase